MTNTQVPQFPDPQALIALESILQYLPQELQLPIRSVISSSSSLSSSFSPHAGPPTMVTHSGHPSAHPILVSPNLQPADTQGNATPQMSPAPAPQEMLGPMSSTNLSQQHLAEDYIALQIS